MSKLEVPKEFKEDDKFIETVDDIYTPFPLVDDNPYILDATAEEPLETMEDLIRFLERRAIPYPYLDDFDILIIPESVKPIIVMNKFEFKKLEEKVCGSSGHRR